MNPHLHQALRHAAWLIGSLGEAISHDSGVPIEPDRFDINDFVDAPRPEADEPQEPRTCGLRWDGHPGEVCGLLVGHNGSHLSWPGGFHFMPEEVAPDDTANRPIVLELPGPPPTGRRVTNGKSTWERHASDDRDGAWVCVDGPDPYGHPMSWLGLIGTYRRLTLVPLTEEELSDEELYGPVTARWGDPGTPCPYSGCSLGHGHAGPHKDAALEILDLLDADPWGTKTTAAHVPTPSGLRDAVGRELSDDVACTCDHPERHRPGCARYPATTGEDTP